MKSIVGAIAALGIAAFVSLGSLAAQQKPAPTSGEDNTPSQFSTQVTRVNMLFTVTDKHGRFVTDLKRDDFEIFENKKSQAISEFMRDEDKGLVVSFDSNAELVEDLTNDTGKLESAIRELRPGGGTSFYDAIYFACRDKLMQDQPLYKYRRAMILISDGEDNNSKVSRDQALEMAQKADVVVYTISTNISRQPTEGDKVMRYFAQQTGGVAFFPFQAKDLNQSFENIANELRHQYNLFYKPTPLINDGRFHAVQIKVKEHKNFVVRARKGYYARRTS
jgi:Ca-activated chloride channel homolog